MTLGKIGARPMVKSWTAGDYVRNGLVAMWDGIENAGWGTHDSNATVWKALVGGVPATQLLGTLRWTENACDFSNGGLVLQVNSIFDRPQQITIEVCHNARPVSGSTFAGLLSCIEGGGVGIQQNRGAMEWVCMKGRFPSGYDGNILYKIPADSSSLGETLSYAVGESTCRLLINGGEVSTVSATSGIRYYYRFWYIGRDVGDSGLIAGVIYSIRLYSRALTAAEIAYNHNIDKMRFNLP